MWLKPIFGRTKEETTAGRMPSRHSEKHILASAEATTTSQAATTPSPPPYTPQWTAATTGTGHSSMARMARTRRSASLRFLAGEYSLARRIHRMSAPAQKSAPWALRTATRTAQPGPEVFGAAPKVVKQCSSSSKVRSSMAFRTSGRSSVTQAARPS